ILTNLNPVESGRKEKTPGQKEEVQSMARKMQIIIVALCTVLLLLGSAAPGRAGSNELNIGYNPDYGLMVGAEVDLQNLTSLPLRGAFEAYTKKYNLFLTALIPLEERLDLYLRPGVAERLYLGLGVKL